MVPRPIPSTFRFARPSAADIAGVAAAEGLEPYTYPDVGATADALPSGWHHDDQVLQIGYGRRTFDRAIDAMQRWVPFDLSWVFPLEQDVPIAAGAVFPFLTRQLGVWSINVCRIAYVVDERQDQTARYGFAYGTVGAHPVRGEERFLLEHDAVTDAVTFRITKFSLPAHPVVRAAGPVARWIQARFTRDALARLRAEVTP